MPYFVFAALLFVLLELAFPAVRSKALFRRGFRTDLLYLAMPPVTRAVAGVVVGLAVAGAFVLLGRVEGGQMRQVLESAIVDGYGPVAAQPLPLLVLEMLLLSELIGYWVHRAFHRRGLPFRIHAVHHSSVELDWLSAVRVHPLNVIVGRSASAIPLLVLGFPLKALAVYLPFLPLYAVFLHANVDWRFGPLRYVIASPVFHRWHHASDREAHGKNFAGLFPFVDWVFGTFYMPESEGPRRFGVDHPPVPDGFWAQLLHPFRAAKVP